MFSASLVSECLLGKNQCWYGRHVCSCFSWTQVSQSFQKLLLSSDEKYSKQDKESSRNWTSSSIRMSCCRCELRCRAWGWIDINAGYFEVILAAVALRFRDRRAVEVDNLLILWVIKWWAGFCLIFAADPGKLVCNCDLMLRDSSIINNAVSFKTTPSDYDVPAVSF